MTLRAGALVVIAIVATACGSTTSTTSPAAITDTSDIHVFSASVEAPASGGVAQVVADLHNAADTKDGLVSVSCSCGGTVTLYEPGATKPATSIPLPSQKVVLFGPRGVRIELSDPSQPLTAGSTVTLTFSFATATPTSATAAVEGPSKASSGT